MDWLVQNELAAPWAGDVAVQFERDEQLTEAVGKGQLPPLLRLWRCHRAVALGRRDAALPGAAAAIARLQAQGWSAAVRLSGGALVPMDPGVLLVSMIYPDTTINLQAGFDRMHRLLQRALAPLGLLIAHGEVAGGYCPGDSDLSAGGRKFCGVSQRRKIGATGVHAFVLVEGAGRERGELAASFYATAATGAPPGTRFPSVRPEVMASLGELTGRPLSVEATGLLLTEAALADGL